MENIASTYTQMVSTIYPDLIIKVRFRYFATVHEDDGETVTVHEVSFTDESGTSILPIDKKTPDIQRFLAHIEEDASIKIHKQRKKEKEKKDQALYIQQVGRGQRTAQTSSHE